jgi:hypothetical protein
MTLFLLRSNTANWASSPSPPTNGLKSQHQLQNYRIIGEFLTMSTLATTLQQQTDFIQQGGGAAGQRPMV